MPFPANQKRLASVRRYEVLDTFPEERFERLTRLAANMFGAPISLISLLDEDRQWFKSHRGIDACETPLEHSFCAHAVQQVGVMVIPDALQDARFATNPLVTGEPGIRFYAGAPLVSPTGEKIGSLCVIDTLPRRPLRETEKEILTDLAALVIDELELRLALTHLMQRTPLLASHNEFSALSQENAQ